MGFARSEADASTIDEVRGAHAWVAYVDGKQLCEIYVCVDDGRPRQGFVAPLRLCGRGSIKEYTSSQAFGAILQLLPRGDTRTLLAASRFAGQNQPLARVARSPHSSCCGSLRLDGPMSISFLIQWPAAAGVWKSAQHAHRVIPLAVALGRSGKADGPMASKGLTESCGLEVRRACIGYRDRVSWNEGEIGVVALGK